MPRGHAPELSEAQRGAIVALRKEGFTYPYIAERVGVSLGAAWDTVKQMKQHHTFQSLPQSGRPSTVTPSTRRHVICTILENRFCTYKEVAELPGYVSERTVRQIAYEGGFHRRVAHRKPGLDEIKTKKRVQWAKDNLTWNWDAVAFCDEANTPQNRPEPIRNTGSARSYTPG